MRILVRYKEKVALKTIEKKACFSTNKKGVETQLIDLRYWYTARQ
jgi:hypothetical protein